MDYTILFIQGAGMEATAQEQVIVNVLQHDLGEAFRIVRPEMPDPDHPNFVAWEAALTMHLARMSGKVILLGHSLGASIILKHFSREPVPDEVIGMILFGIPYWKNQDWDVSEYVIEDEFVGNLRRLDNVYLYHSMDDEVIPYNHFESYARLIPKAHWKVLNDTDHSYHGAISYMLQDIRKLAANVKA